MLQLEKLLHAATRESPCATQRPITDWESWILCSEIHPCMCDKIAPSISYSWSVTSAGQDDQDKSIPGRWKIHLTGAFGSRAFQQLGQTLWEQRRIPGCFPSASALPSPLHLGSDSRHSLSQAPSSSVPVFLPGQSRAPRKALHLTEGFAGPDLKSVMRHFC